jgi:outer membrane protein TolC
MVKISDMHPFALIIVIFQLIFICQSALGQSALDSAQRMSIQQCIDFALSNQPIYKQSKIDEEIAERTLRANLAGWFPQISGSYALTHYWQMPVSLFPVDFNNPSGPKRAIRLGVPNQSSISVTAQQILYSGDLMLAAKAGRYARLQATENTTNNQINIIVNVSKAFYDVLITEQQLAVTEQDIVRQQKLLDDTYNMYVSGVADKIDYKRTTIALNNSKSSKKRSQETLHYKYTYLKQQMGFPSDQKLSLIYDTQTMRREAVFDTTKVPDYKQRIEYQLLQTQMHLQQVNEQYYKYGFVPTIAGYVNYNLLYLNKSFSQLYSQSYPNSSFGVTATVPIFTGTRRLQNVQKAKLQVKRVQLDQEYFKEQVQTQYAQAMGAYKSNWNDMLVQEENLKTAQEVYDLVKFQYQEGIKAYVDVITSESDLRQAELNYLNAVYNLLSSKLDLQKALGVIK